MDSIWCMTGETKIQITSAAAAESHTIFVQDATPCVGQIDVTWGVSLSNMGIY